MQTSLHKDSNPIAVLGAGSWGTALALYLARKGQIVNLWTIETDHAEIMQKERSNQRYLPQFPFPDTLHPEKDLSNAIINCIDILIAVPSVGFRSTLSSLKSLIQQDTRLVWATKGLDESSGQFLHVIAEEITGKRPYAAISGPSFAQEVAAGLPTAVALASTNSVFKDDLMLRFNSSIFHVYPTDDFIGIQLGGTVKNIIAIAIGMSDGLNWGTNARCALITRGFNEMKELGLKLGAKEETLTGLAGLGDLILTCTDNQSRNRRFGLELAKGEKTRQAESKINQVVEGKKNAELIVQLAQQHKIKMPVCETVLSVLLEKQSAEMAMKTLWTN